MLGVSDALGEIQLPYAKTFKISANGWGERKRCKKLIAWAKGLEQKWQNKQNRTSVGHYQSGDLQRLRRNMFSYKTGIISQVHLTKLIKAQY